MKIRILASLLIVALAVIASGTRDSQAASENSPFVPGQLIAAMANGANASEVAADHGATVSSEIAGGRFVLLNVARGKEGQAARSLNGDRRVSFVEPNWLRQVHVAPDDTGYNLKWDLDNTGDLALCDGSDCPTYDADMDWQEAYDLLGSGVNGSAVVAVIDTGIDPNHPDLNGKIVAGYDYLDADNDPTDTYGHGMHVAGISLANTNNMTGTAGVGYSPSIKVMPLRVCDQNGCPTSAIVNAIYHAADNGAEVSNMSIGGTIKSRAEESAVNYAWSKGLVIVASSGNDGMNKVSYPAKFKKVIAVGSTDWNDVRAPYSNGGKDLDVVAPGGRMDKLHDKGGIYSTMPTYPVYLTTQYSYSQGYDQLQGTSMAGPQVAGLAALLIAQDSSRSNADIRSIIESTTDDLGASGFDNDYGNGRVNVCKAVGGTDCDGSPNDVPVVSMTSPSDGATSGTGAMILFEGAANDTEDGDISASLTWTSSINGSIGTGASFSTTLSDGDHTITASVTDSGGMTSSDTTNITVGTPNDAPVVSISSPSDGATFGSGASILFAGSASDTEDGSLTASMAWTSSIDGSIGTGSSFSAILNDGSHTITASATDSGGKMDIASVSITVGAPPTLSVTVTTDKPSYSNRQSAMITVTVTDGTNPVAGAVAQITVSTPKGNTLGCSPTTDSVGIAKCTYKVNSKRDGGGTYTVIVTASKSGYVSGSDDTTFTAN